MKNSFIALAALVFSAVTGTNELKAQTLSNGEIQQLQQNSTGTRAVMDDREAINPKAVKNFTRTYKDVTTETWLKTKDGFAARFISEGIRNTILYDTKGHWTGIVKNYTEEKLPTGIRQIVKSKYYDYSIFYVDELETVESAGVPTYVIHLEDKNSLKLVRLYDGEMETWKEYKKR
jgi:hypothetical protein